VQLSWTAPASNGGSAITGYTVTAAPGGATCTTAGLSCTVNGLVNGTAYTFTVVATNGVGTSTPSAAAGPYTPRTVPGVPTGVSGDPGNTSVTVSWLAPASNGGAPITEYTVTATPGGATCATAGLSCTVTGLTNGTSYTFKVVATNAVGDSLPSAASPAVTPGAPPGPPLSVAGAAGDQSVEVLWAEPGSDGGSPIISYTVTASPGGAQCTAGNTAPLKCTVTGLTNGTPYIFTVTATNAVGTSAPSAPSIAITPREPTDCGAGQPGPFPDVPGNHPFCLDIEWLVNEGVTGGFTDGTFKPTFPVTRGSMAAFLYRYAGEPAFTPPAVATFPDVPTSHVFFKEIEWLVSEGITGGYDDGTYKPSVEISRGSMAAFLYRFAGEPAYTPPVTPSFSDVPLSHPFYKEIEWLAEVGITGGFNDGTFKPSQAVSRQAMAAFLHRYDDLSL
jgi:hypothetical protein